MKVFLSMDGGFLAVFFTDVGLGFTLTIVVLCLGFVFCFDDEFVFDSCLLSTLRFFVWVSEICFYFSLLLF